jgi:hypothetical protein
MTRTFFIAMLIGLSADFCNAQANFMEGYYVTGRRDTVHGFIMNRSAQANFFSFLFKPTLESKSRPIYPNDAELFNIGNSMVFERHTYKGKDLSELTGFFKVLVRGKLALVTNGKRYFALTSANDLLEVTSYREVSGTTTTNPIGFGTVKALMKDCPTTDDAYLSKEYADKNLKSIFVTYNQCIGNQTFVSNDIKAKTRFNIGLQLLPSIAWTNAGYPMNVAKMGSSRTLAGGLFFSAFVPGTFERLLVMLEANYYQYTGYGYFAGHTQNGFPTNSDIFVKYHALQVPLFVRMGDKFFADFGIQNHLTLTSDISWRNELVSASYVDTEYRSESEAPRLWTTGLLIGGGMKFEVVSFPIRVFARYSRNGNPFFSGKPGYQMASIGLSFQFTKN